MRHANCGIKTAYLSPDLGQPNPVNHPLSDSLLFPEKEAKSVVLLRRRLVLLLSSAKPTLASPQKSPPSNTLLFPEKEAKSVVLLRRRPVLIPNLGEADPGGLGASPQGKPADFFQKKKQKA
jgi:hypothetical protein